jgi:colanic acid/amylovoran biosynthesis glycosyltransferase
MRHPEARLLLVGDGEMRAPIERRIRECRLGDKVTITGWMDSQGVHEALVGARAFVLPSFAEGLPVVIMEALALGRPVISTYIAGIPELVRPSENGWLVPASDIDALANAMNECMSLGPSALVEMGARGRAAVLEFHDVTREAARLGGLMQDAVAESRQ